MLQKIYISDKYCSSELSIHKRNLKKNLSCLKKKNLSRKLEWFLKDCVTLNSTLKFSFEYINSNFKYIQIESSYLNIINK